MIQSQPTVALALDTTQSALQMGLYRLIPYELESYEIEPLGTVAQADNNHRYHSARLFPELQGLLKQANVTPSAITQLWINQGPGSFTGIRTGLTVARLWAQVAELDPNYCPNNLKVAVFNTFELMAADPQRRETGVTVLLNAYRQQTLTATLQVSGEGGVTWQQSPQVVSNDTPINEVPWVVVESSLAPLIEQSLATLPQTSQLIRLASDQPLFTPGLMAWWMGLPQSGITQRFRYEQGKAVEPMYIQQPHITIKQ